MWCGVIVELLLNFLILNISNRIRLVDFVALNLVLLLVVLLINDRISFNYLNLGKYTRICYITTFPANETGQFNVNRVVI